MQREPPAMHAMNDNRDQQYCLDTMAEFATVR